MKVLWKLQARERGFLFYQTLKLATCYHYAARQVYQDLNIQPLTVSKLDKLRYWVMISIHTAIILDKAFHRYLDTFDMEEAKGYQGAIDSLVSQCDEHGKYFSILKATFDNNAIA
jgi:hypothetical protein